VTLIRGVGKGHTLPFSGSEVKPRNRFREEETVKGKRGNLLSENGKGCILYGGLKEGGNRKNVGVVDGGGLSRLLRPEEKKTDTCP